jgi:hypothetical protein
MAIEIIHVVGQASARGGQVTPEADKIQQRHGLLGD